MRWMHFIIGWPWVFAILAAWERSPWLWLFGGIAAVVTIAYIEVTARYILKP